VTTKDFIRERLATKKRPAPKIDGTVAESEFTDLERDLEDQISELNLEQMNLTMNTHLS